MNYVAILKSVGQLEKRPPEHRNSHPDFPLICRQYPTQEAAELAHPEALIMTVEAYQKFKQEMNQTHGTISRPKKSWWKFW